VRLERRRRPPDQPPGRRGRRDPGSSGDLDGPDPLSRAVRREDAAGLAGGAGGTEAACRARLGAGRAAAVGRVERRERQSTAAARRRLAASQTVMTTASAVLVRRGNLVGDWTSLLVSLTTKQSQTSDCAPVGLLC